MKKIKITKRKALRIAWAIFSLFMIVSILFSIAQFAF